MSKQRSDNSRHYFSMTTFSFRCPNTGLIVQGWITHDPTKQADTYEPITCTACSRTHWVDPKTRKVLDKK
jgi:hypothetical protein